MLLRLGNFGRTLPTGSATGLRCRSGRSREREKNSYFYDGQHDSRDLLVQGDREPLGGALQCDRAVLRGAEAPGVVDRRELGPHAADRL